MGVAGFALIALAIYAPALRGTWLWDDRVDLPDNPVFQAPHPLRLIWSGQDTWDYYPIKNTLQWIQWKLWGDHTLWYHLTNVGLHVLSAALLWRLLRRLGLREGWAWVGGLLFLVHPVAVGSVAWIAEFKDSLSLPLLLLAANAYVGGARCPNAPAAPAAPAATSPGGPRNALSVPLRNGSGALRSLSIAWLFFAAAMLAKSSVMMFPCGLLLYGWYARRPLRRVLLSTLPFFAVSLVCGWIAVELQHHRAIGSDGTGVGGTAFRLSLAGKALAFYLRQAILPHNLAPVYGRWPVGGYGWWLVPMGVAAVGWWKRETWGRAGLLGFGWFGLNLVPVLGVVGISFMRFSWVMDHLAYAALIGLAGLAAAALQRWAVSGLTGRIAAPVAAAAAAAALLVQSRAYARAYESEEALWSYSVKFRPEQWMGYSNLGAVKTNQGRLTEALPLLEQSVRMAPDAADAHRNLAVAYNLLGRPDEALAEARRALELRPNFYLVEFDLGTYLAQAGRYAEALPYWMSAVKIRPNDADLRNRYGFTLVLLGRRDEGVAEIKRALALNPNWGPAELNLGLALSQAGQDAQALPHYEAAARLMPNNAAVRQRLSEARKHR